MNFTNFSRTYLNARSNQVAHYLVGQGVKPDTLVGLCVERSLEMVVGLLGILKAGGAYVPLDPTYPQERLRYMLEDSGVGLVLSQSALVQQLPLTGQGVLCLDSGHEVSDAGDSSGQDVLSVQASTNLATDALGLTSRHLAYVIYTSGSTGRPKGVMVEHRGWVNLGLAQAQVFDVNSSSRCLQLASLGFDASVSEIVMILLSGGALYMLSSHEQRATDAIAAVIASQQITHATLPPLLLKHMPRRH